MKKEILKKLITDELIENRTQFNRVNYIVNQFRGFIYDNTGNYLQNGEEIADFISEQDKKLTEIDNRPRDYSELFQFN